MYYSIPLESRKIYAWHDGFTAAIEQLAPHIPTAFVNIQDIEELERVAASVRSTDFILAKSNWGWIVDNYVRRAFRSRRPLLGIMISGSEPPPVRRKMAFYDILYYETPWYRQYLQQMPPSLHAFGIDTRIMTPARPGFPKTIDVLSVGAFRDYKRQYLLASLPGRKIVIGDSASSDPGVLAQLNAAGIETMNFMPYEILASYYQSAKLVYIPATVHGGGERAVLEAIACGIEVRVESDNPKLVALAEQRKVWGHEYYARQLAVGIALSSKRRRGWRIWHSAWR